MKYKYQYVRISEQYFQETLDQYSDWGYRIHSISHSGAMVHVVFEMTLDSK